MENPLTVDQVLSWGSEEVENCVRETCIAALAILGVTDVKSQTTTKNIRKRLIKKIAEQVDGEDDDEDEEEMETKQILKQLVQLQVANAKEREADRAEMMDILRAIRNPGGRIDGGPIGNPEEDTNPRLGSKINVRPPVQLEGDISFKDFKSWLSTWNNYVTLTKLNTKTRGEQIATFFACCSPKMLGKIRHAMGIGENTTKTLAQVVGDVRKYLKSQTSSIVDRYKLLQIRQAEDQRFDDFLVELLEQEEDAEIANMTLDDWTSTLIIVGLKDEELREELLALPNPTLEDVKKKCRAREASIQDGKTLSGAGKTVFGITKKNTGVAKPRIHTRPRGSTQKMLSL